MSELLFTQLADKVTILERSLLKPLAERKAIVRRLKEIEKLRDKLAHANDYAPDNQRAAEVSSRVRNILYVRDMLTRLAG